MDLTHKKSILTNGSILLGLRLVIGWTYFSAFWRRLILENKLNPDETGYIGEKFNHFLPNALGIKPVIEYLLLNPEALWWAMVIFTIIEAVVGLFIMLGLFTRLMSAGVFFLALGILLGSGWLGTTCLDEWQIGVLGIACGFSLFLAGGGNFSLDARIQQKLTLNNPIINVLTQLELRLSDKVSKSIIISGAIFLFGITLYTNQFFHGGLYGKLHNKSVKPHLEINNARIESNRLNFDIYRTEGADVYGSFLIRIGILDQHGKELYALDQDQLKALKAEQIRNKYIARIKPGKHSLVIPLGAKATIWLYLPAAISDNSNVSLLLTDISGITWSAPIMK